MNFGKRFIAFLATGAILTMSTSQIFAATLTLEQAKNIALGYVPEERI